MLLGALLSRLLHARTPPSHRLGLLASPGAWLLAAFGAGLALAQDRVGAGACASLELLPASALALAALLLLLQLLVFHDHLQLVPLAVAADSAMRLASMLAHDGSAAVPAAQAAAAALLGCLLVLSARLCASLATPPAEREAKRGKAE